MHIMHGSGWVKGVKDPVFFFLKKYNFKYLGMLINYSPKSRRMPRARYIDASMSL